MKLHYSPRFIPTTEKRRNSSNVDHTVFDFIKDYANVAQVKKIVNLGSEVFTALEPFLSKPTMWTGLCAGFGVCKVFVDDLEVWSDDYFSGDEWVSLYSSDFSNTILKILVGFPYKVIRTNEESSTIRIVDVNGYKVGYVVNARFKFIDQLYIETKVADKARDEIQRLLWAQYKDCNLVMRQNKQRSTALSSGDGGVVFDQDEIIESLYSKKSIEYSAYLKRCIDADVPRSVMLYGPPGTGKSTMARTIVSTLHMRSFRIRVEDVADLDSATLFEAIHIFQPDAIILDDFDRSTDQSRLLETLEFFQRHVKLVIATVNDRNSLDEAILRPGRFDELVFIKHMDTSVVKKILGEDDDELFELVKDWPISFINELVKRRKFQSKEEAIKAINELMSRVARLKKYDDDEDDESPDDSDEDDEK